MADYVRETAKKSRKYCKYGSFEHLLFLLCMYVCMYVCTYVHVYICMHVCMHLCMYACRPWFAER